MSGARRRALATCGAVMGAAGLLTALMPSARSGLAALVNALFDASEAANAYAYQRLPVAAGGSPILAAALLGAGFAGYAALLILSHSRLLPLLTALLLAGGQAYFGLSLPPAANVAAFSLLGLLAMTRPVSLKAAGAYATALLAVSLAVAVLWPGVDAATEAASERARDWLSQAAGSLSGEAREIPPEEMETRHVFTQSLREGEGGARPGRTFRLVSVEETQIAMPRWIDYVRIALLLLLTGLAVFLPLTPFMALAARRRRALAARRAFQSADVAEAIRAIFSHAVAWLDAMDCGAGNLPYVEWTARLSERMSPEYAARFEACAALFEEAFYSDHAMDEAGRAQALSLLEETERTLTARATRRQRLRLRYKECLLV